MEGRCCGVSLMLLSAKHCGNSSARCCVYVCACFVCWMKRAIVALCARANRRCHSRVTLTTSHLVLVPPLLLRCATERHREKMERQELIRKLQAQQRQAAEAMMRAQGGGGGGGGGPDHDDMGGMGPQGGPQVCGLTTPRSARSHSLPRCCALHSCWMAKGATP
jgi:hypothetical protein